MTHMGMRDLKEHMGRFVALVKKGEPVTLRYRGKPFALVQVIERLKSVRSKEENHLLALEKKGLVSGGNGRVKKRFKPLRVGGKNISDIVIESRE